jgi:hypothetical protein
VTLGLHFPLRPNLLALSCSGVIFRTAPTNDLKPFGGGGALVAFSCPSLEIVASLMNGGGFSTGRRNAALI